RPGLGGAFPDSGDGRPADHALRRWQAVARRSLCRRSGRGDAAGQGQYGEALRASVQYRRRSTEFGQPARGAAADYGNSSGAGTDPLWRVAAWGPTLLRVGYAEISGGDRMGAADRSARRRHKALRMAGRISRLGGARANSQGNVMRYALINPS